MSDTVVNATAFPLPDNVMCPPRTFRLALRIHNPAGNGTVTITYPSGFVVPLAAGASLYETVNCPQGKWLATGTNGQTLRWEETFIGG